jgi:hypothetical protein
MTRYRRDSGQATVLTVLFLAVLIAMAAAVLDVGSWYRADRALQATADAAALAGAQALPENPAAATALALQYAGKNGGGITAGDISITTTVLPNDTIAVDGERSAPGFFAKIFSIDSVTVGAGAKARAGGASAAQYVAPIVVNEKHPKLQCDPPPCSGPEHATEIDLIKLFGSGSSDAAGAFGLIDLRADGSGNPGASEMAGWMLNGFDQYMAIGNYDSAPSANFNNSQFKGALDLRLNTEVLFPIYRKITGSGTNAEYEIIGWVGFVPTSFKATGSSGKVYGYFTKVIWEGILTSSGSGSLSTGVKTVSLVE